MPAPHAERRSGQEGTMTTSTIKPEDVKRLREKTGAGIMDCKRALEESAGDFERATVWLREKGLSTAAAKAGRAAREGIISSYIHHGERLGVLLELNCETDFVARTADFKQLARDLAMTVAGHDPAYVSRDDVPEQVLAERRTAFAEEARQEGRPADRIESIVEGKLNKWLESVSLLEQPYRDTDRKIADLVHEKIALLGENIRVARFVRMAVGESPPAGEAS
jgi:elongation factor Ts